MGDDVDRTWIGRRVTGDNQIGCGHCYLCLHGRQYVCDDRSEFGLRGRYPGALAEQLLVPVSSLYALPDEVDATAGAMVEPGGNSLRAVWGAAIEPGFRILILGAGTIGLLAAQFALAEGAEVVVADRSERALRFAESLGGYSVHDIGATPGRALRRRHRRIQRPAGRRRWRSTLCSLAAAQCSSVSPGRRACSTLEPWC